MPHYDHKTLASNIPYGIRPGATESFTAGRSEFSCIVICPYDNRFALAADFLGYSNTDPLGLDKFTRVLPEFYEGQTHLPCIAMQLLAVEGFAEDLPAPDTVPPPGVNYNFLGARLGIAVFRAIFTSVDYPILEDEHVEAGEEWRRYTWLEEQYAPENIKYPGNSWVLVDYPVGTAGRTILEPRSLPFSMRTLVVHWLQVPHFSRLHIESCINRLNETEVQFTRGTVQYRYPPETLLFEGWKHMMERSAAGQLLWNLEFHFRHNPEGWNKIFRSFGPVGPGWYRIGFRTDGSPPYDLVDFHKLWSIVELP